MYIKGLEKLCIPIIEDCTHSFFPSYKNSYVVLSFGATKVITSAEGGGIFFNSKSMHFDLNNLLKGNGHYPYRQSDIHSALLYSQLMLLRKYIKKRERIACLYTKHLSQFNRIKLPDLSEYTVIYRYVLRFANVYQANAFIKYMKSLNIMCERPITPCPEALKIENVCNDAETIVSLPIYPSLKKREIRRILKAIYKMEMF